VPLSLGSGSLQTFTLDLLDATKASIMISLISHCSCLLTAVRYSIQLDAITANAPQMHIFDQYCDARHILEGFDVLDADAHVSDGDAMPDY